VGNKKVTSKRNLWYQGLDWDPDISYNWQLVSAKSRTRATAGTNHMSAAVDLDCQVRSSVWSMGAAMWCSSVRDADCSNLWRRSSSA